MLEKAKADPKTRQLIEERENAARNYASAIADAKFEGMEEGEKIGIEKGEKLGIEKGEKIGVIGYQKSPFEENAAFVTENVIKEEYRGLGYGKSALVKLQEDAKEKGFSKMVLNCFKHTPVSFSMYEKNGFRITEDYGGSVIMEKLLQGGYYE